MEEAAILAALQAVPAIIQLVQSYRATASLDSQEKVDAAMAQAFAAMTDAVQTAEKDLEA